MAAASIVRRTTSRVPTTKVAATNDDDPAEEKPKAKRTATKTATKSASASKTKAVANDAVEKPARSAPASKTAASTRAKPPATRMRAKPNALVQRVYNTIDGELTKLEKQKGLTSQDRERASRALSQMVNALEKAVEMQRVMTKRKPTGGDAKSKEALAHAENLRREIAERLERLNHKRSSQRNPE
ncbi:hypothetical protein [Hyphomicrobium facile]|uniref:hypothetical protein n=1 Tax=Hyphomicrobium facile TaxID=51670 RepID=UPI000B8A59B6|nr:hypothetical protein [Hyphomicrobium facile]